jgi:ribonuclease HII
MVSCAWRLELDHEVMCGSRTSTDFHSEVGAIIRRLEDQVIESVTVDEQTLDFVLTFLGGRHRLSVFCDAVDPEDEAINYSLHIGDRFLMVAAASVVTEVTRKRASSLRLV